MKMKDFYETLGVSEEASPYEIKQAYRKLSLHEHPDHGGSHERMQFLNEAYAILSDPLKRHAYTVGLDAVSEMDSQSQGGLAGYLKAGNSLPYSYSFRKEHKALLEQYLTTPLEPISLKEREGVISTLYQFSNPLNGSKVSYPSIFALLEAKKNHPQPVLPILPEVLTPELAVQLFLGFLYSYYYGAGLARLINYFAFASNQNQERALRELYQGFLEIMMMAQQPEANHHALTYSLKKLTQVAKEAPDNLLLLLIPIFTIPIFASSLPMR